ncbi:MAG: isoprenylcysteine carboxyl methyltransferase, partial [Anaerolineae bacterium]|nr:isoprenylcysteine carboxyl methyltransferase [Anaerolineae bacterium]
MKSKADDQKADQTTSPRQWISLIMVYLFIPLFLFLCGGDFGWWQAWVYALLIVAAGVGGRIW